MFLFKKKQEEKQEDKSSTTTSNVNKKQIKIFFIDSDKNDWHACFEEVNAASTDVEYVIDQNEWSQIYSCTSYSDTKQVMLHMKNNKTSTAYSHGKNRQVQPHVVVIRKLVQGIKTKEDYTNTLMGLMHSNMLCINSAKSIFLNQYRPLVYGELLKLRDKYGNKFPLIDQYYFSEPMQMLFTQDPPIVLKVGTAEAGYGKIKVENTQDIRDIAGTITRYNDFVTTEPFIKSRDYDIRVQKIGSHYRAYKRVNSNWKGNVGSSVLTEIEVTDTFKFWADIVYQEVFNSEMDIFTVDAVHTTDDKYYILEINDSASGFAPQNYAQDMKHVRDVVLERVKKLLQ